jgi:hypothetical protein
LSLFITDKKISLAYPPSWHNHVIRQSSRDLYESRCAVEYSAL